MLFVAVAVCYVASLVESASGPRVLHCPAVAMQVLASTATIAVAWAFYERVTHVDEGRASMALLSFLALWTQMEPLVSSRMAIQAHAARCGNPDSRPRGLARLRRPMERR